MNWFSKFFKKKSGNAEMCGLQPADNPPPMPPVKPPSAELAVGQVWEIRINGKVFFRATVLALKDGCVQYDSTLIGTTPTQTETPSCITERTVESFVGLYNLVEDT